MVSSSGDRPCPRIAVFAGPTATVLNSHPLVTSGKARRRHGLPALPAGEPDALRPQRLALPVTVYVEQFSAHPLERDAAELHAAPDAWVTPDGSVLDAPSSPEDRPVHRIDLDPADGLYPLPYMGRQADGTAWEADAARPEDPAAGWRQPFHPDSSRVFEEIDRLMVDGAGHAGRLQRLATYDHHRAAPSGGWTRGLPEADRTDIGTGDVAPEVVGVDFFPYRPASLRREPLRATLADLTNRVQEALGEGTYDGALWLEGSPYVEETAYWLNLLIDTTRPIAATSGSIGPAGAENVIDAATYVVSGIWADDAGADRVGVVCVHDEQVLTAREVQKSDDRPGGFTATGGHGGVVATMGKPGPPVATFVPVRRHTSTSEVRLTALPDETTGLVRTDAGALRPAQVRVRSDAGRLLAEAVPAVHVIKHVRYQQADADSDDRAELELFERARRELDTPGLVGFVIEAGTPYGDTTRPLEQGLARMIMSGVPVVKVGRGDVGGFVPHERVPLGIAGGNLTATKARVLLMACLLRFGALRPAQDPLAPTAVEEEAVRAMLARYQTVFDSH